MENELKERPQVLLVNRCFIVNDEGKILLIKRASNDSFRPGFWECPGGKLDQGQDLTQAREREVLEETGLRIQLTHPLVYADSYIVDIGRYTGLPYICLYGIAKPLGGKLTLSSEHSEAVWATYDEGIEYNLTPEVRKAMVTLKDYLYRV